jgi:hypothetical protein
MPPAVPLYDYGGKLAEGERIGVMRSDDLGKTWKYLGHAGFRRVGTADLGLNPVDITPVQVDAGVALYFFDLQTNKPGANHVIYRAVTGDGVHFTTPVAVIDTSVSVMDPFILKRLNVPMKNFYVGYLHIPGGAGIYTSNDGMSFTSVGNLMGARAPGALELPGQIVRVFGCDGPGISSWKSPDGIGEFIKDAVDVLSADPGTMLGDPHPIPLRAGGFLPNGHPKNGYVMTYKVRPNANPIAPQDVVFLATSPDGSIWTKPAAGIVYGSVPSIVELADGVLLLYYVDFK